MVELLLRVAWQSDWSGDEIGYPELGVIGLFAIGVLLNDDDLGPQDAIMNFYYDVENNRILEVWFDTEDYE